MSGQPTRRMQVRDVHEPIDRPARKPRADLGGLAWFFIVAGIGLAMALVVVATIATGISIGETWRDAL